MSRGPKSAVFSTTIRCFSSAVLLAALASRSFASSAAAKDEGDPVVSAPAASTGTTTGTANPRGSWYGAGWKHLSGIWDLGGFELYAPVYTFHMPYAYTRALLRSYNDVPLGGGIGKGRFDENGNWEGVFVMEFSDSHRKPEYEGGYAWIATWHPFDNQVRIGAGYGAFITARSDIGRYTPFPGVLPLGSIGYLNLDLQSTFVPGGKNDGNVLFTWIKLSFY